MSLLGLPVLRENPLENRGHESDFTFSEFYHHRQSLSTCLYGVVMSAALTANAPQIPHRHESDCI